jgi:transcriptional regulator with GAF, ATPase, and Fis domain
VFQQLELERIVTGIGADIANSHEGDLVAHILDGLEKLGEFARADGCMLIPLGGDGEEPFEELWWVSPSRERPARVLPDRADSGTFRQIRSGQHIEFRQVGDLDPSWTMDREAFQKAGVKSGLMVPVFVEGVCFGAMGICSFSAERIWPESWVPRLVLIGQIFANGLIRARRTEEVESLRQQLQAENAYLRKEIRVPNRHDRIVGESEALRSVLERVQAAAPTDSTILILGETGTGKELIADAIHELSPRKGRPMITVNCAAIPASLAETELFGRAAGAYTGADTSERGRFETADGSTIFLDEIGELPLAVQAKLLRVLQGGEFQPVGCPETRHVDVRIIAATNRDLDREVRRGRFREDLYHRLNVIPIQIPPLRERLEDIPPLVRAFVDEFGRKMGRPIQRIPQSVFNSLQRYSWPGNIRELRHILERAMVLADGEVLQVTLPADGRPLVGSDMTLEQVERKHIEKVLERTRGRVEGSGGAAEILGLKPSTLRSRLAKLGIQRDAASRDNS